MLCRKESQVKSKKTAFSHEKSRKSQKKQTFSWLFMTENRFFRLYLTFFFIKSDSSQRGCCSIRPQLFFVRSSWPSLMQDSFLATTKRKLLGYVLLVLLKILTLPEQVCSIMDFNAPYHIHTSDSLSPHPLYPSLVTRTCMMRMVRCCANLQIKQTPN